MKKLLILSFLSLILFACCKTTKTSVEMTSGSGRGASITSDSFKISKLGETYEFNSLDDNVEEKRTLL